MNRRILAAGNGDQLTEVTPNGVLLVWKWNPINKQYNRPAYTAHSGDWSGQDAINVQGGAVVLLPTVDDVRGAILHDAEAAKLNDPSPYAESMVENFRRQQREGANYGREYEGRELVDQETARDGWD